MSEQSRADLASARAAHGDYDDGYTAASVAWKQKVVAAVAAERERSLAIVQSAVADFLDRKIYIHNGKGFQAACEIIADKIRISE